MARFLSLIDRFGEGVTTGGISTLVPDYVVPAGAKLGITDITVMTGKPKAAVIFWLNETTLGHIWCAYFNTPGTFKARWETPISFVAGQAVSMLVLGPGGGGSVPVAASWSGELLI